MESLRKRIRVGVVGEQGHVRSSEQCMSRGLIVVVKLQAIARAASPCSCT